MTDAESARFLEAAKYSHWVRVSPVYEHSFPLDLLMEWRPIYSIDIPILGAAVSFIHVPVVTGHLFLSFLLPYPPSPDSVE